MNAGVASRKLSLADTETKNRILLRIAELLEENIEPLLTANRADLEMADENNVPKAMRDRLALSERRILGMCQSLRALIELEGIRLQPGVGIAEDALFNLEAVLCGRGIAYVNRVAYRYRTHSASAMHTQTLSELQRHAPWLEALRDMLLRRGQMEAFFPAYVDSVALRLYKDGGVGRVIRRFREEAAPLLPLDRLEEGKLSFGARLLLRVCRAGAYPLVYPLIYPVQVLRRKLGEAAFALRAKKEMPK